jgi:hypothetical protein
MAYSTITKPSLHFNTKLFTGTGSSNALTGIGFQPDWVWIKDRQDTHNHNLFDAVRGVTKRIHSDTTDAETTNAESLKSFDSDGFTLGTQTNVNQSGHTNVAWNWKAGGSGSANTDGSINTTATSINTTAGFSIITYTGTGSAGTIGHGLGVKPDFWQIKARSETRAWYGWHKNLALGDKITLNEDGAKTTDTSLFGTNAPTNQVINLGSSVGVNNSGQTFVCYAFAEKKGYSKMGAFTGNGNADGVFVYTGFKPAFLLIKIYSGTGQWTIFDNKRSSSGGGNEIDKILHPNVTNAENTADDVDFLSNGFKMRNTAANANGSGSTYLYMAFAEEPLVANVGASIPATAR